VRVDGIDLAPITRGATLILEAGAFPILQLEIHPDAVTYTGPAVVHRSDLDGIERLRARLNRQRSVDLIEAFEAARRRPPEVLA
jgi:hypothetical protein